MYDNESRRKNVKLAKRCPTLHVRPTVCQLTVASELILPCSEYREECLALPSMLEVGCQRTEKDYQESFHDKVFALELEQLGSSNLFRGLKFATTSLTYALYLNLTLGTLPYLYFVRWNILV